MRAGDQAGDDGPEFPDVVGYVWAWFCEILAGVAPNGMVAPSIGWRDLAAWCELTGEQLDAWEARLLIELSANRFAILSEEKPTHGHPHQN